MSAQKADAIIHTNFGDIKIRLYDDVPGHKANFLKLAEEGKYDSSIFHRVIENFMIQGGDIFAKDGTEGRTGVPDMSQLQDAEMNPAYVHKRGAIAAARMGDQVNPLKKSSTCQFYIVDGKDVTEAELAQVEAQLPQVIRNQQWIEYQFALPQEEISRLQAICQQDEAKCQEETQKLYMKFIEEVPQAEAFKYTEEQRKAYLEHGGYPFLDMQYTVFGEVIEGMDVVDKIAAVKKGPNDRPVEPVVFSVEVVK